MPAAAQLFHDPDMRTPSDNACQGFLAALPVAVSVAAYGSVLGVLAAQQGLTWLELLLMNLFVFAGSAQFVIIEMWATPLPILPAVSAAFIINLRYLLIGASLSPLFAGKSLGHKLTHIHLVGDENWAVTMAAYRQGRANTAFLLGSGICVYLSWSLGTLLGHRLGAAIHNPEVYALDFAFIAVFTALAVSLWRGKCDLAPWIVAAGIALLIESLVPGKWYIIAGGLSGATVALLGVHAPSPEQLKADV